MKYADSFRCSGGGVSAIIVSAAQHKRLWMRFHWPASTLTTSHFTLRRLADGGGGDIWASVSRWVTKSLRMLCASKEGTTSESSENKFMWERGRHFRVRGRDQARVRGPDLHLLYISFLEKEFEYWWALITRKLQTKGNLYITVAQITTARLSFFVPSASLIKWMSKLKKSTTKFAI